MFGWWKKRRRRKLRAQKFSDAWRQILLHNVPYAQRLTNDERRQLEGHIHILLHEKHWEGCGGLELSDEIRVTVAAQAALLLLNRQANFYPKLTSILIYPDHYRAEGTRMIGGGIIVESEEVRAGESWYRGAIVVSWSHTQHGAINTGDGLNVVLHEFAHQLDAETGSMNGTPLLPDARTYDEWARICTRDYRKLQSDLRRGRFSTLRPYAATNPAEFFAVATETFFERPAPLRQSHPELYDLLRAYYHQDPAARLEQGQ